MATSQTMYNPTDWLSQSYHNTDFFNFGQAEAPPPIVDAAAVVSRANNLSPDQGRVAKPIRRRSRVSRRTPTTLLNTDKSNFRAMVQRFTGCPSAAYAAGSQVSSDGVSSAINFMEHIATPGGGGGASPAASGFLMQYQNQELQHQQMMFIMGGDAGPASPPPRSISGNENRSYETYML